MSTLDTLRAALNTAVAELPDDQLPDFVGMLEATKARTSLRLQQQSPVVTPKLVDASEMAAILGTPENWVRDRARAGVIPAIRLGHYVRFSPPDVLDAVSRMPALHDSGFRGVKKRTETRGGRRSVSNECPSSTAEKSARSRSGASRVPSE